MASLAVVLIKINGGKPSKIDPYPRPITAAERVRLRNERQSHDLLVARLLPR